MIELWQFYQENFSKLGDQLIQHIGLTLSSVFLACIVSVPLGILIAKRYRFSGLVLNIAGILQTIPSIALLGFLIPLLGIGIQPAIFALFLYSLLPIIRNVFTGIHGIDTTILESARGMGMSAKQILFKVEIPIALPMIFAGIRTATVINVGVATLAAYIAAGGLGEFIFGGIALNNSTMIIAGALPAALLAITLDFLLGRLQKSSGKKVKRSVAIMSIIIMSSVILTAFGQSQKTPLTAGFAPEFTGRKDGLPALKQIYNLNISSVVLGPALMYKAIHEEYVDVISGYSTDGRINSYSLKVLVDDKKCFPPYEAALLMNQTTLKQHPELLQIIGLLDGTISDSLMTHLNYLVDHEKMSVDKVAKDFLMSQNLYQTAKGGGVTLRIGSKIFTEQYILTAIYKQLIEGYTHFEVETKNGLGGTKICLDALTAGEIDFYPEYSGTALQVILNQSQTPGQTREEMFEFVRQQMSETLQLAYSNPLGFNNTYALMMREVEANRLGIKTVTDLQRHLSYK